MSFVNITERVQFTVLLSQNQLINLLTEIRNNNINISGLSIQSTNCCSSTVKFITNNEALTSVILQNNRLSFSTSTVLSVPIPSTPGSLQTLFAKIYCQVRIISSYIDESLDQILEVDNVQLARQLLQTSDTICPIPAPEPVLLPHIQVHHSSWRDGCCRNRYFH